MNKLKIFVFIDLVNFLVAVTPMNIFSRKNLLSPTDSTFGTPSIKIYFLYGTKKKKNENFTYGVLGIKIG